MSVAYQFNPFYIQNGQFLPEIIADPEIEYFWQKVWQEDDYINASKAGAIIITHEDHLLFELQPAYGILDFKNLKISKKQYKIYKEKLGEFTLSITANYENVLSGLLKRENNWLNEIYAHFLFNCKSEDFTPWAIELKHKGQTVAGEIGYEILGIYTSLSGYFDRENITGIRQLGFLQLQALSKLLEKAGIKFWNLGHPHMQYKMDLGSIITERSQFLERFIGERGQVQLMQACEINLEQLFL